MRQPRVGHVGLVSVHTSPLTQPGSGDSGGLNVALNAVAHGLAARGVAVEVFTRATAGDLPARVRLTDGVTVHHITAGPHRAAKTELSSYLCAFYLQLAANAALAPVQVLHGHYWMGGWVGRQIARRHGLPLVQSFHTLARVKNDYLAPGEQPEPAVRIAAEERIVADADAVLAPTTDEVTVLRERYGARPGRVHLVPPGVDLDVFSADLDRHAARQALGGGRIVLFVGRLQPLKAPDLAVRALAALDAQLPDDGMPARLVVVGGPSGSGVGVSDAAALGRLADQLGVADRVAFLSPRPQPQLALLYRAADAVIVPSTTESFGLVALEAQACGTPVVAADVGGLREVVGAGGTLVSDRQPEAFAAALVPYVADARRRAATGAAGRRTAEAYGWDRSVTATLDVYGSLLGQGSDEQRRGA